MEKNEQGMTPQDILNEILHNETYKNLVMTAKDGSPFAKALQTQNNEMIEVLIKQAAESRTNSFLTEELKAKHGSNAIFFATNAAIEQLKDENKNYDKADVKSREVQLKMDLRSPMVKK